MKVTKIPVGSFGNNAYLVTDCDTAVLIDAADEASTLLNAVGEHTLKRVVTTHRHADHIRALAEVAASGPVACYAGDPDADAIACETGVRMEGLWDGDSVRVGRCRLEVIGLVGHTPGSIALAHVPEEGPVTIFTGDALFPGGLGKTETHENFETLYADVVEKIFDRFGDDTIIHPGHGESTTLGAERPHLAEWRARGW